MISHWQLCQFWVFLYNYSFPVFGWALTLQWIPGLMNRSFPGVWHLPGRHEGWALGVDGSQLGSSSKSTLSEPRTWRWKVWCLNSHRFRSPAKISQFQRLWFSKIFGCWGSFFSFKSFCWDLPIEVSSFRIGWPKWLIWKKQQAHPANEIYNNFSTKICDNPLSRFIAKDKCLLRRFAREYCWRTTSLLP